jgi:hypothetical protein
MNTKQIRLTTTASTRVNTITTSTRKKDTTSKTQIIKDVKLKEKLKVTVR